MKGSGTSHGQSEVPGRLRVRRSSRVPGAPGRRRVVASITNYSTWSGERGMGSFTSVKLSIRMLRTGIDANRMDAKRTHRRGAISRTPPSSRPPDRHTDKQRFKMFRRSSRADGAFKAVTANRKCEAETSRSDGDGAGARGALSPVDKAIGQDNPEGRRLARRLRSGDTHHKFAVHRKASPSKPPQARLRLVHAGCVV